MNGTSEIAQAPEQLAVQAEEAMSFASRLRVLAAVIERNPGLQIPYDVRIAARTEEEVDRWAAALRVAGHDYADVTDAHARVLSAMDLLVVAKVHDESMRRYHEAQKFLAEHQADIDARLTAQPVASASQPAQPAVTRR